jgi:hypothetical protein
MESAMTAPVSGSRVGQPGIPLDEVAATRQGGVQRVGPEEVPSPASPIKAGSGSGPNTAPLPSAPPTAKRTQPVPIQIDALEAAYGELVTALNEKILHGGSMAKIQLAKNKFAQAIDAEIIKGVRKSYTGIYDPGEMNQRAQLIATKVAESIPTSGPLKAFIFAEAIRHVQNVRAIKNLIALDTAITLGDVKLDKATIIVADAAHWITEPDPSEIKQNATEQEMAENQFSRLLSMIEAARENVAPEILAAVVAACGKDLLFFKADESQLEHLQKLIGTGNRNANKVILQYRSVRA